MEDRLREKLSCLAYVEVIFGKLDLVRNLWQLDQLFLLQLTMENRGLVQVAIQAAAGQQRTLQELVEGSRSSH